MRRVLLIVFCCFCITALFAQSPKAIEDDLDKAFKKVEYWSQHRDTLGQWSISLEKANKEFGIKLQHYTSKYPITITYPFHSLKKDGLDISTSDDGLFSIYSWDTRLGGTMRDFENVFQYKSRAQIISVLDTPKNDIPDLSNYHKMYTFKTTDKTYYLAVWLSFGSTKDIGRGVNIFQIENGKLVNANIIKTGSGMHSQLSFAYDLSKGGDEKINSDVYFDEKNMSISLPLVAASGKLTAKTITYKFAGQYFEKVKN